MSCVALKVILGHSAHLGSISDRVSKMVDHRARETDIDLVLGAGALGYWQTGGRREGGGGGGTQVAMAKTGKNRGHR